MARMEAISRKYIWPFLGLKRIANILNGLR